MDIYVASVGAMVRANSGNVTVPVAPDIVADDILLVLIAQGDNVVATYPGGWTTKGVINGGANSRAAVLYRRATGGEGTALITHAAGADIIARMVAVRGCVNTGDPFDSFVTQANGASTTQIAFPTATPGQRSMCFVHGATGSGDTSTVFHLGPISGGDPGYGKLIDDQSDTLGAVQVDLFLGFGLTNTGNVIGARTALYLDTGDNAVTLATSPTSAGITFSLAKQGDGPGSPKMGYAKMRVR